MSEIPRQAVLERIEEIEARVASREAELKRLEFDIAVDRRLLEELRIVAVPQYMVLPEGAQQAIEVPRARLTDAERNLPEARFQVLVHLRRHGAQRADEIAQALEIAQNAASAHLRYLLRDKLVKRGAQKTWEAT